MVFHWSLSDSKSPHVSRTLLSILAFLNNVVVWMISTRPPTSKSTSPFSNPFVTVPNAPIAIGIIVACIFHRIFICARSNEIRREVYELEEGKFSNQRCIMVFHWNLRDGKSFQVSSSILSILADLRNVVVLMVSILPLISNPNSLSSKSFESVPSVHITIGITSILLFHGFFF